MEKTQKQDMQEVKLIRILQKDIPGDKTILSGISMIKGVSWSFAHAVCKKLNIPITKRIEDLSEKEIQELSEFIKNPKLPEFLFNRKKDPETGEDKHLIGSDLDLRKEFDIKGMKKMKSYKGVRHTAGLPVRGQKTKANFRPNKKKSVVGVKKAGAKR